RKIGLPKPRHSVLRRKLGRASSIAPISNRNGNTFRPCRLHSRRRISASRFDSADRISTRAQATSSKFQTSSSKEAPGPKHQTPEQLQAPRSKRGLRFGAWNLGFVWCLELGFWCFNSGISLELGVCCL